MTCYRVQFDIEAMRTDTGIVRRDEVVAVLAELIWNIKETGKLSHAILSLEGERIGAAMLDPQHVGTRRPS